MKQYFSRKWTLACAIALIAMASLTVNTSRAADVAISALPAAVSVATTDTGVIVQSGTTKKFAVSLLPFLPLSGGGTLTMTAATNSIPITVTGSTTGYSVMWINNTSGSIYSGVEGSVAGTIATGTTAYDGVIGSSVAKGLCLITTDACRLRIDSAGAATFSGLVTINSGLALPGLASSSAATTGTMCWTTGTGNVNIDTTTTCLLSGEQFKQDDRPLENGLQIVMALKPKIYSLRPEFNPTNLGEQIGFFAQDVAQIEPRLVSLEENGNPHAVRYQQLTAALVSAIQEQQAQINALKH